MNSIYRIRFAVTRRLVIRSARHPWDVLGWPIAAPIAWDFNKEQPRQHHRADYRKSEYDIPIGAGCEGDAES